MGIYITEKMQLVTAIRIGHHCEALFRRNQFVNQGLETLIVHVGIACTVSNEKMPLQAMRPRYGRTILIAFHIILGQPHEALLVAWVIESLVTHK